MRASVALSYWTWGLVEEEVENRKEQVEGARWKEAHFGSGSGKSW